MADWERVLRTNLTGPFVVSREACKYMREKGRGHIVNIASTRAIMSAVKLRPLRNMLRFSSRSPA